MTKKTVSDYLKDPRLLNDKGMADAPECIREIHAIRLKIQDEYDVLSPAYEEHCRKTVDAFYEEMGAAPLYADLSPVKTEVVSV